jgi:predicted DNA-binding transcriptional regulator AlpA
MILDDEKMQTLSLVEVCELLKITEQTGRNRLSTGRSMPPNFKIGRKRLFLVSEVENWIKEKSNTKTSSQKKTPYDCSNPGQNNSTSVNSFIK